MSDAFVTMISIQPSEAAQLEHSSEADALGTGQMKHGLYGKRRRDIIRQAGQEGVAPEILPRQLMATPGEGSVTLSWAPTAGVVSYNLYWALAPGVTKQSACVVGVAPGYQLSGLVGGQPYYLAISAVTEYGEGELGDEVSATPSAPIIPSPILPPRLISLTAQTVNPPSVQASWSRFDPRAPLCNLYWATAPGVTNQSTKVSGQSSIYYTLSGLDYDTTYYVAMSAYSATEESALSNELSFYVPKYVFTAMGVSGAVGRNQLTLPTYKADTISFNLYWSLTPGVTKSSNKVTGVTSGYIHDNLTPVTTYYYAVAAVGPGGEGPLSVEVSSTTLAANPFPAGVVLWLDANDPTSWSGSGTQWMDKSGNGYHVNGVSAAQFATYNGQTVFRTSGTASTQISGLSLQNPCTVMVVARYNGLGTNQRGRILSCTNGSWLLGWWSAKMKEFYAAGWVTDYNSMPTADTNMHCAIGASRSGNYRLIFDGGDPTASPAAGTVAPASLLTIGGHASGEYSNADVAMIVAWNRQLSQAECVAAYEVIAARFGIPVSDPKVDGATHALFKLDSGAGTYLVDTANHMTLTKGGTLLTVAGRGGANCIDCNNAGYGAYMSPAYENKNFWYNDFTVEGWLQYPTGRAGTFPEWFFFAGASTATSGRGLTAFVDWSNAYGGNKKIIWLLYPGSDWQMAGVDTAFDTWTHFAFRRKYDSVAGNWLNEAWQNGVQVASGRSAAITAGMGGIYVGSEYGGTAFAGRLQNIRLSSRYRTDDELRWFFNNT